MFDLKHFSHRLDLVKLIVTLSIDVKEIKQQQIIQTGILRQLENEVLSTAAKNVSGQKIDPKESSSMPNLPLENVSDMYELEAKLEECPSLCTKMVTVLELFSKYFFHYSKLQCVHL